MSVDAAMSLLVGSAWGACVWTAGGLMPSDVWRCLPALRSRVIACGKRAASMKSGAKSEKNLALGCVRDDRYRAPGFVGGAFF